MAVDEVTYAMEIETKLGKYLIEGTIKTLVELAKLLIWIFDERIEEGHVTKGSHSIRSIMLMSKPAGAQTYSMHLKVKDKNGVEREISPKDIEKMLKKAGVRYCTLPNINNTFAISYPPTDSAQVTAVFKAFEEGNIKPRETVLDKLINKRNIVKNPIEKENISKAIEEIEGQIDAYKHCIIGEKPLDEWLKEVAESNTEDLAGTLAAFNEGIEDPWTIKSAEEMCQSLRSEYSVETEKDSNYNFYVADNGGRIRREYHNLFDETPGNVYSTFEVLTTDGQIVTFTDKDKTSEEWAKEIPQMLAYAGIEPNERMMSFSNSKEATRYVNDRERIIKNERKRINSYVQGMVEKGLGFKQPGTATQVRDLLSEEKKRRVLEYSDPEKYTEIIVPRSSIVWSSEKEHCMIIEAESGGRKYSINIDVHGVPATSTEGEYISLRMPNKTPDGKNNEAYAIDLTNGKKLPLSMKELQAVTVGIYKNAQAAAERNTLGNNPLPVGLRQ